jgi:hypothetical protein
MVPEGDPEWVIACWLIRAIFSENGEMSRWDKNGDFHLTVSNKNRNDGNDNHNGASTENSLRKIDTNWLRRDFAAIDIPDIGLDIRATAKDLRGRKEKEGMSGIASGADVNAKEDIENVVELLLA